MKYREGIYNFMLKKLVRVAPRIAIWLFTNNYLIIKHILKNDCQSEDDLNNSGNTDIKLS